MANQGPALEVDGALPSPPRYTLFGAAEVPDGIARGWEVGVAQRGYPCTVPTTWDPCSSGTSRVKSTVANDTASVLTDYNPFVVEALIRCTTRTRDLEPRLRAWFQAVEHFAFEREVWAGARIATNPHLAQVAGVVTLAGSPGVGPVYALTLAEDAIADTGRQGFIHAPANVGAWWMQNGLVVDRSGRLFSPMGNVVVPASGYAGTGPDGTDPNGTSGARNLQWVYATGPVRALRGELSVNEDVDRSANDLRIRAERTYAALIDRCVHAAILVNLPTNV